MNKRTYYYSIAILATVTAGVACLWLLKRARRKKITKAVAEAGYETAHDIHFPLKINKPGKFKPYNGN